MKPLVSSVLLNTEGQNNPNHSSAQTTTQTTNHPYSLLLSKLEHTREMVQLSHSSKQAENHRLQEEITGLYHNTTLKTGIQLKYHLKFK